jgi:hypothetical protein
MATLTSARLKQVLGCLQEFNLLREAVPRIAGTAFVRAAQPMGFALSCHSHPVIESLS